MIKTIAQEAYEAFRNSFSPNSSLPWTELPTGVQKAWTKAAERAVYCASDAREDKMAQEEAWASAEDSSLQSE